MNTTKNRRSPMTPGERLMFLAGILFCLVLITTSMMGGLFARYTTTGTGSDSARVAKFAVGGQMNTDQINVVYSLKEDGNNPSEGTYVIKVTSDSEVAVSYDINVTFEKALPNGISLALYQGTENKMLEKKTDTLYKYMGSFAPGVGNQAEYELRFLADWTEIHFNTEGIEGNEATLKVPFDVNVTITQID